MKKASFFYKGRTPGVFKYSVDRQMHDTVNACYICLIAGSF